MACRYRYYGPPVAQAHPGVLLDPTLGLRLFHHLADAFGDGGLFLAYRVADLLEPGRGVVADLPVLIQDLLNAVRHVGVDSYNFV